VTSFKLFDEAVDDVDIVLLEDCPCERKEQLHARERHWIDNTECVNKIKPGRTIKEWCVDNKQKILDHQREYHQRNRDKILDQQKEYHRRNRDKVLDQQKEYHRRNRDKVLDQQKEYHRRNKEKIAEYHKEHYQQHKEQISQPIACGCGSTVTNGNYLRHAQSDKHKQWVDSQQAE
jgi:hypothetical protein